MEVLYGAGEEERWKIETDARDREESSERIEL